ncbi:unnamed protein product [Dibothriocephalus latus]|uniref:Dynein light chain n=1 Tax=Dibothriocephalus latus TaxID=60516 RepID=A0A3P7LFL6_DIBLA|nr:unnamed protein product [Dibothriocephalus latus]
MALRNPDKPEVLSTDVDENKLPEFLYIVVTAYATYRNPEDMCTAIKQELDRQFNNNWHVIVGLPFGM